MDRIYVTVELLIDPGTDSCHAEAPPEAACAAVCYAMRQGMKHGFEQDILPNASFEFVDAEVTDAPKPTFAIRR